MIGGIVGAVSSVIETVSKGEKVTFKSIAGDVVSGAVSGFIIGISKGAATGLANYASAAAESIVNETCDYISGDKEFTGENVIKSFANCVGDAIINGTSGVIGDKVCGKLFPLLKTNSGWFIPRKFKSFFTKSYGQKIMGGMLTGASFAIGTSNLTDQCNRVVDEFIDYLFDRDPIKLFN